MKESPLTDSELAVIKLLISGQSNKELCLSLHVSRSALQHRLDNIMAKMKAQTMIQAIAGLVREGVV